MSNVAYVRVSTEEQNEARQKEALSACHIDKWFEEKISGKDTARPEFQKMMDWVREGDTIFVHDLSRIARSTKDLLFILHIFRPLGSAEGLGSLERPHTCATNPRRAARQLEGAGCHPAGQVGTQSPTAADGVGTARGPLTDERPSVLGMVSLE